ncbi:MAG: ATP-binding protein [Spirochaetia bacterium]|nr:ATP-binding protein [Spirochaetia bacterium]
MSLISKNIYARTKDIREACIDIENNLSKWHLEKEYIFPIVLTTDEILTNIYRHGKVLNENIEKNIKINIIKQNNCIKIIIIDNCGPYNINITNKMDMRKYIKTNKNGGFGFIIIYNLMDLVKFQRKFNKNIIIMKKLIQNNR